MMDVFITVLYVVACVFAGLTAVAVLIFMVLPVLFCCWRVSAEERAAAERRDALVAAYARARRSPAAAPPAPVEVELVRPVAPVATAAVVELGYFPYSAEGRRTSEKLECAICLEVLVDGAVCSEVPACQHLFHRDCIGVWMKTKTTCPLLCRGDIVAASEQLSAAEDMV